MGYRPTHATGERHGEIIFWRNKATDLVENKETVGRNRRNKPTVCARHWGSENETTTNCGHLSHVDSRTAQKGVPLEVSWGGTGRVPWVS